MHFISVEDHRALAAVELAARYAAHFEPPTPRNHLHGFISRVAHRLPMTLHHQTNGHNPQLATELFQLVHPSTPS